MKEEEIIINNLLAERTSRAVEKIFSENSSQQIKNIFDSLQNRIRNSSNELRQTLYRKYENLINCSQLLDNLYDYAKELSMMSQSMQQLIKQKQLIEEENIEHEGGKIKQIEKEISKHNYFKALQKCYRTKQNGNYEQVYYMEYLQLQILQKLQQYFLSTKLNKKIVQMALKTINLFIQYNSPQKIAFILEGQQNTLLSTLQSYFNPSEPHSLPNIISALFEFKLTHISICSNQEQIQQFFCSLLQLCDGSSQCQQLGKILQNNYELLETNLIHIFIQKDQNGLKFQNQLYKQLLDSKQFLNTLITLQTALYPSGAPNTILQIFNKLWQNYYHQVIEYGISKISPLSYIQQLQTNQTNKIPNEITYYSINNLQPHFQSTFKIINMYQNTTMPSLISTLKPLFQHQSVVQLYNQRIYQLNQQLKTYKFSSINNHSLRQYILIHFLVHIYNQKYIPQLQFITASYLEPPSSIASFTKIFNNVSFQLSMIDFDTFFIGYCTLEIVPVIQPIIINLLNEINEVQTSQTIKDRLKYIVTKFLKQPHPISMHKELLTGIGKDIFGIQYSKQQLKVDKIAYGKYLHGQKVQKISEVEEQFEIGEKQKGEDMVTMGVKTVTNYLSGFMKKK